MQIVFLLIFVVIVIRGLFDPFIGLIGLFAVTMINPGELYPVFTSLHLERVLALLTVVGLVARGPNSIVYPRLSKRILIFWAAMFISVPFSFWPGGSFGFTLDFGRIILYHFLIVNLVNTPKRFLTLLVVFTFLLGWVGGGALWGYAHGSFDPNALRNGFERAQGLTTSNGNPNSLGLTLVAGLPLVVLLCVNSAFLQKALAWVVVCISVTAILLTGSRTTFSILCLLVTGFMLSSKVMIKFVPVVLIAALCIWAVTPEQYKDRYKAIVDITSGKKTDESYESHRLARQAGLAMFLDYPITGVGAGQFAIASGQRYWPGWPRLWLNPHNLYVQIPAELGLLGIASWISFLILFLRSVLKLQKQLRTATDLPFAIRYFPSACLFSLASLFLGGCFGHNLYRYTWYQLAGMIVALEAMNLQAAASESEMPSNSSEHLEILPVGH